jgi:hypothetical protein
MLNPLWLAHGRFPQHQPIVGQQRRSARHFAGA